MNEYASSSTKARKAMEVEAKIKRRAIECRKIRMFIAQNPGSTTKQVQQATGVKSSGPFFKMLGMGIIRLDGPTNTPSVSRWYVVPQ